MPFNSLGSSLHHLTVMQPGRPALHHTLHLPCTTMVLGLHFPVSPAVNLTSLRFSASSPCRSPTTPSLPAPPGYNSQSSSFSCTLLQRGIINLAGSSLCITLSSLSVCHERRMSSKCLGEQRLKGCSDGGERRGNDDGDTSLRPPRSV